jgi:hypothetical protein
MVNRQDHPSWLAYAARAGKNLFHHLGRSAKLGRFWLSAWPFCNREPYAFTMRGFQKKPRNRCTCKAAGRIMHTAAEYREMAEECFDWAAAALTDEIRATYLSIAQIWLQAAARLDGGLPIRGGFPVPKRGNGKSTEPEPSQAAAFRQNKVTENLG